MTPAARLQTAIELLDQIIAACRDNGPAADRIIAEGMKARRYAGSKDRRAVRELVYRAIRRSGDRPVSGRAAMIGLAQDDPEIMALFNGAPYGPAAISPQETASAASLVPVWLESRLETTLGRDQWPALLERAPLDIRLNRLKLPPLHAEPLESGWTAIPGLPDARRIGGEASPEQTAWLEEGLIEVQDAGSQAVTLACSVEPGMIAVDLCAGAGGKTLALAAMMANRGRIVACDADRARLSRLAPRANRAGVTIAETRLLNPGRESEGLSDLTGAADMVLIDAPCSGMGTWRRNPEGRWRLTPERLGRLTILQYALLETGAALVKPGGALVYVVCSLLDAEGADQVSRFAARHPQWSIQSPDLPLGRAYGPGWRLTPAEDGTDGFFVARLVRS